MPSDASTGTTRTGTTRTLWVGDGEDRAEVTVRWTAVRRLNLRVSPPDGRVTMSVPLRTPQREVQDLLDRSLSWIVTQRARIAEAERCAARTATPPPRADHGATWWHLGRPLEVRIEQRTGRPTVVADRDVLVVRAAGLDDAGRLAAVERWQRRELTVAARTMVAAWGPRVGVPPAHVGVRRMRTRWGTCVITSGRVWLSLALAPRPPESLELVLVHELVHLREAAHGPRFDALMDVHLPDWRERDARLTAPWPPR